MSISALLARYCTQKAVYWGNPQEDGYGSITYDAPIEIECRWEDIQQIMGTVAGNAIIGFNDMSRSIVYVTQDLHRDGMLYLGPLIDLDSDQEEHPKSVNGAFIIKRFERIPSLLDPTDILRIAYLTPWLT
jgi:hypothetical protein